MRPSSAPEGGKVRARAAAALDAVAGAWGDGDMLGVLLDTNGEWAIAAQGTTEFVLWTPEGRKDPTKANYKEIQGGRRYTGYRIATFQEAEVGTSPALGLGDNIYAEDAGDAQVGSATGAVFLGWILPDETKTGGMRLHLEIGGKPVGA